MAEGTPRRVNKAERIAGTLRTFISAGIYPPNSYIQRTKDLRQIFRTSQPTISTALAILVHEGLVDTGGGTRTKVRLLTEADAKGITTQNTGDKFVPGNIPEEKYRLAYVREMGQKYHESSLVKSHENLVSIITQHLQAEQFPDEDIERVATRVSALLDSKESFPITSILNVSRSILLDARILRKRNFQGDTIAMSLLHPATFYLKQTVSTPVARAVIPKPRDTDTDPSTSRYDRKQLLEALGSNTHLARDEINDLISERRQNIQWLTTVSGQYNKYVMKGRQSFVAKNIRPVLFEDLLVKKPDYTAQDVADVLNAEIVLMTGHSRLLEHVPQAAVEIASKYNQRPFGDLIVAANNIDILLTGKILQLRDEPGDSGYLTLNSALQVFSDNQRAHLAYIYGLEEFVPTEGHYAPLEEISEEELLLRAAYVIQKQPSELLPGFPQSSSNTLAYLRTIKDTLSRGGRPKKDSKLLEQDYIADQGDIFTATQRSALFDLSRLLTSHGARIHASPSTVRELYYRTAPVMLSDLAETERYNVDKSEDVLWSKNRELELLKLQVAEALATGENLPIQFMGLLSAAVGNHEGIAALISKMDLYSNYSGHQLYVLMMQNRIGSAAWYSLNARTPADWCIDNLVPTEMVTQGKTDGVTTFSVANDQWSLLARSFAGRSLVLSERHGGVALAHLQNADLQTVNKDKDRKIASENAVLNFRLLLIFANMSGTLSQKEILAMLRQEYGDDYVHHDNLQSVVSKRLHSLRDSGLITYEEVEHGKPLPTSFRLITYRPFTDIPATPHLKTLTYEILDILAAQGTTGDGKIISLKKPEIFQIVAPAHANLDKDRLMHHIGTVLNHLAKLEVIEKLGFTNEKRTRVSLTPGQREIIADYVRLISEFSKRASDPAYIEEGIRIGQEFVDDPIRYSLILKKAREHSRFVDSTPSQVTSARMVAFLREKPCATVNEIRQNLKSHYGQQLGDTGVLKIIHSFMETPIFLIEIKEGKMVVSITDDEAVTAALGQVETDLSTANQITKDTGVTVSTEEPQSDEMTGEEIVSYLLGQVGELPSGTPLTFFGINAVDADLAKRIHKYIGIETLQELLHVSSVGAPQVVNPKVTEEITEEKENKEATEKQMEYSVEKNEIPYIQESIAWAAEVRKRGDVPHQRIRSFLITPSEVIAKALRTPVTHLVNETRRTRGITLAGASSPYIYDMTQTYVPFLWLNQLVTSDNNLPIQPLAFADSAKTRERTTERKPTTETAQRYGIDKETSLLTHATHYYDERGIPIAIKLHVIPASRAPQEYLDAIAA